MAFARNLARVLRDDDGKVDSELVTLGLSATALTSGVGTLFFTGEPGWALGAAALALPLQLVALAYKFTAIAVAVLGTAGVSIVAGTMAALLAGGLEGLTLGALVGAVAGYLVGSTFQAALRRLEKPGWY